MSSQCESECLSECNGTLAEDPSIFRRNWYSLASSTVMYTVWAGYTCVFVATTVLFVWSRKIQPIKSRSPEMVVLSAVGGYLLATNFALAHYVTGIQNWPCPFSNWSIWLAFPLFLFPFPIRSLMLYLVFKRNVDKVKNHSLLQAKTAQRVTVVEQRFSMSANGANGASSDVQKAIEKHKQKKAEQKSGKNKTPTIAENAGREDGGHLSSDAGSQTGTGAASSMDMAHVSETSGNSVKRMFAKMIGLVKGEAAKPGSNSRKSVHMTEVVAAESGLINTQSNRSILEKYIYHLFFFLLGACFITGIVRQFIPSLGLGPECVGCLVSFSQAVVQIVIVFIILGIQCVASIFIFTSDVKDQFHIGRELQFMTIVWVVLLIPACILAFQGTDCDSLRSTTSTSCGTFDTFTKVCYYIYAAQHWLLVGCVIITFLITICVPLFATHRKGRKKLLNEPVKSRWPSFKALTSLKECLTDKDAADAFQKFCVQAFCVEQILFWKDAEQFRLINEPNEIRVRAIALYKRYIDSAGALFVQLPEELQDMLDNILGEAARKDEDEVDFDYNFQVTNTAFIPAQMEVFRQMENETFPSFLRSDIARKLFQQFEAQAAAINALRERELL